eukprot:2706935-Alexandrium_andersonii.AAC.1
MSASLVGSEMCIRDRVRALATDTLRVRGVGDHTSLEEVRRAFQAGSLPHAWWSAARPAREAYLRYRSSDAAAEVLGRDVVRIAGRYIEVFRAYPDEVMLLGGVPRAEYEAAAGPPPGLAPREGPAPAPRPALPVDR